MSIILKKKKKNHIASIKPVGTFLDKHYISSVGNE